MSIGGSKGKARASGSLTVIKGNKKKQSWWRRFINALKTAGNTR